jgi:hypothetical protein
LVVGVRKSKKVREGEKGKKGVDVKTGRDGICSQVYLAPVVERAWLVLVLTQDDERKEK